MEFTMRKREYGSEEIDNSDQCGCETLFCTVKEAVAKAVAESARGFEVSLYHSALYEGEAIDGEWSPDLVVESDGRVHPFIDLVDEDRGFK